MIARLDATLVRRGLARSRGQAAEAIRAGLVSVNGRPARKPSDPVDDADVVQLSGADHYVSRAAHKLLGALDDSRLLVAGRALDAGASTGGFTQVLLQRGAEPVYAIDVGHDQLVPSLRNDPRVRVHEGLNLRELTLDHLDGHPVDLVAGDVSFISLRLLLRPLLSVLVPAGDALLLVKPQFEVGRRGLDSRGVVRSEAARVRAVDDVVADAAGLGWQQAWRGLSRTPGASGNVEYFVHLRRPESVVRPG
ncbi:MAG: TlyA family RNA methyltransferase [Micropruina sp.]|nr:TlyA family RNA methyltransferase [Micropruina sp.]